MGLLSFKITPAGNICNTCKVIHLSGESRDNQGMDIHDLRYNILRAVMQERHMNLRRLAATIDRSESQVSSFAGSSRAKNIGEKIARHIEQSLQLPQNYLDDTRNLNIKDQRAKYTYEPDNAAIVGTTQRMLPVIGMASAGKLMDNFEETEIEEWVYAPGPCTEKAFVLRIDGISMEPDFMSGDRIVIDPGAEWKSGDFVFARHNGDDSGTFKKLRCEGDSYYLCATNPEWKPKYMAMDDHWHIVGKALYQVKLL